MQSLKSKGLIFFGLICFFCSLSVGQESQDISLEVTIPSNLLLTVTTNTLVWDSLPIFYDGTPALYPSPPIGVSVQSNVTPGTTINLGLQKLVPFENQSDPLEVIANSDCNFEPLSGDWSFPILYISPNVQTVDSWTTGESRTGECQFSINWDGTLAPGIYQTTIQLTVWSTV